MKLNLTVTSAALAAMLGLSQVALAEGNSQFTPVEELSPEQRQAVFERLSVVTNGAELDWDHIAVGVNESNEIVITDKAAANMERIGSPSTWASAVAKPAATE